MSVAEIDDDEFAAEVRIGAATARLIDEIERTADRLAPTYQCLDERSCRGFRGALGQRRAERAKKHRGRRQPPPLQTPFWHGRTHAPPISSRCANTAHSVVAGVRFAPPGLVMAPR